MSDVRRGTRTHNNPFWGNRKEATFRARRGGAHLNTKASTDGVVQNTRMDEVITCREGNTNFKPGSNTVQHTYVTQHPYLGTEVRSLQLV